jgi:alkaline phosphatase D
MPINKLTFSFFSITALFLLITAGCGVKQQPAVTTIAFGSCANQDLPQPILGLAASYHPDLFIFLGDNIYGDTDNMDTLQAKYNRWAAQPTFQQLKRATRFLATWDDHDFGQNDIGRHYAYKEASKKIFLDFFNEPTSSERRTHAGIYHDEYLTINGRVIQIILLDNRTFRDNVRPYDSAVATPRKKYFYALDYSPYENADSTLLGKQQWAWLDTVLRKPADIRLLCSGSQFGIEYNGYEAWANFPQEQQKMISLIQRTKANGVIFLTGDVHYGELSKLQNAKGYPLYDFTSSGITSTWSFATPNANRIEGPVMDNNFGLVSIFWEKDPRITLELIDATNNTRVSYSILLSQISF